MCTQGQQEIQQAYNDLTSTCNACQTQQNLKTLQNQGCQGCATAQQVIQNVQNQASGCSSCAATQNTMFNQMQMPQSQQNMLMNQQQMPLQGLVQPMLTPLVGTNQNILNTVSQQPGMMAGQLPINVEMGPPSGSNQQFVQMPQQQMQTMPMQMQQTTQQNTMINNVQPMPVQQSGPMLMSTPAAQGSVIGTTPALGQGSLQFMQPGLQMAPQMVVTPPPQPSPAPVMQPVIQPIAPTQPAPVQQPAPVIQTPQYTPAQIAAIQNYANSLVQGSVGAPSISGIGGIMAGVGGGSGKAPGATVGQDVNTVVLGGSGYGFGGVGVSGVGGPGAFDTHRPDLHAGGGWHNVLPAGAIENVFNLY